MHRNIAKCLLQQQQCACRSALASSLRYSYFIGQRQFLLQRASVRMPRGLSFASSGHGRVFGAVSKDVSPAASQVALDLPEFCGGCGVKLQQENVDKPGYFQLPKKLLESPDDASETWGDEWGAVDDGAARPTTDADGDLHEVETQDLGGRPSGGMVVEEETSTSKPALPTILCARCYSLRHYGTVKNLAAEAILPDFDIGRRVGRKIALTKFRRAVLLCVVDVTDFDGSLPRLALNAVLDAAGYSEEDDSVPLGYRLVIAVNKVDLIPPYVSKSRLEQWVRRRAKQGGLPRPASVPLISSKEGRGIQALLTELREMVGGRGDVWVIGAQNAGKSSMINAMRRVVGLPPDKELTTAIVPGTTLGLVRVDGVLSRSGHMYDTPGVPHSYQLTSMMNLQEVKMLLPSRAIRPRTFRLGAGSTVMIGGVARIDVLHSPGSTLYLTVWASMELPCHFGKTDTAEERYEKHAGSLMQPPIGDEERLEELGPLEPTDVKIKGVDWQYSSSDVAIAGLGWVGVGVSGTADLRVWTYPGVSITTREALVPDYAEELERPGFGAYDKPTTSNSKAKSGGKGGKKSKR